MVEWINDEDISNKLNFIQGNLKDTVKSGSSYFNDSIDYLFQKEGKLLRPLLLLTGGTFGKNYQKNSDKLVQIATSIETLHVATLLHDDVIDNSKLRRGQESIQSKYSKKYAIYMGDYLLSKCFLQLAKLDMPNEITIGIAKAVNRICLGEILQNKNRFDYGVTPFRYLRNVSGKTAALFGISLSAGGYISKCNEITFKRLGNAGYQIGMAFQIVDDVLDFVGDQKKVGKELQKDILQGFYSIPVIYALNDESSSKSELNSIFSKGVTEENISRVIKLINDSGAVEKSKLLAKRYHDRALDIINRLPDGRGKNILNSILPKLLERIY